MTSLPFALRVPGKDAVSLSQFTSTKYRFQGRVHLAGAVLVIKWSGTAVVEEVGMLGVAEETITLPHESIFLPVDSIARMRLLGGWWRPRIEITAGDLMSLRVVPSEDGGRVCPGSRDPTSGRPPSWSPESTAHERIAVKTTRLTWRNG